MMRIPIVVGVAVLFCQAAPANELADITSLPPHEFDWQVTEEGVAFAALEGDRFAEPYMAMVQLPAGLVSPAHIKSASMFGVVVSGTMTHTIHENGTALQTELPEGSYYKIPAGLPHVSACVSATDCVTFLYQDGKFDFLPVQK